MDEEVQTQDQGFSFGGLIDSLGNAARSAADTYQALKRGDQSNLRPAQPVSPNVDWRRYLPLILIGAGVLIVVAFLAFRKK